MGGKMKVLLLGLAVVAMLLFGCVSGPASPVPGPEKDSHGCNASAGYSWCEAKQKCIQPSGENCTAMIVGNDRDSHGCIPSAGYTWCAAKSKCIRQWEENCTAAPAAPVKDSHGCVPSEGSTWCDALQKCIKASEQNCTVENSPSAPEQNVSLESIARVFCGRPDVSKVYVCGDYVRVVSSLEGAGSRFYKNGVGTPLRCPVVAPDSESDECRLLLTGNNCTEKEIC